MAEATGIGYLEIHRFHNAVINDNIDNSFKPKRAAEIAKAIAKAILKKHGIPNSKMRGEFSQFANELGISFNDLLEFAREIYHEIIDEALRPQSR